MTATLLQEIRKNASYAFGCVVIILSITFLATTPKGISLTNRSFDTLRTTAPRTEAVIIGIDDKSLQTIGAWPWNREVFAELTQKLDSYGARSVVYDILFLEPRVGDSAFKEALIAAQKPIILAAKVEGTNYLISYLIASTTQVFSALANVHPDTDGKVRSYAASLLVQGTCLPTLSQLAFHQATFKQEIVCNENEKGMFRYPKDITTYSLTDVLSGNISRSAFLNKTVFIGATSLDLQDTFVGMDGQKIPGIYVHASQFVSRLNAVHDVPLSRNMVIVWFVILGVCGAIFFYRWVSLRAQLLLVGGFTVLLLGAAVALFEQGYSTPWLWSIVLMFFLASFSSLLRAFEERKKNAYIQSIFSKYVHPDVLAQLLKSSSSLRFDGERRDMTILFSDLRGFTTISEKMEPEELTKLLNGYFSAMTPCILEEKGTIDKFIGDAVMAFWNAPLLVENHPTHAVRAALMMVRALKQFNLTHQVPLAMGIGVHRGEVIVGNVGSLEHANYTVLGDAVNLASRIEGLTKKYGVVCIVTEAVRGAVKEESIVFRKLDIMTVKGKNIPTVLYEAHFKEDIDKEIITSYEEAFGFYEKGMFDQAEALFAPLAKQGDAPSRIMLERLPLVRKANDWDGVWHFDEK